MTSDREGASTHGASGSARRPAHRHPLLRRAGFGAGVMLVVAITMLVFPMLRRHVDQVVAGVAEAPHAAVDSTRQDPLAGMDEDVRERVETKRVLYQTVADVGVVDSTPQPIQQHLEVPFADRTEIDVLVAGIDARLGRVQTRADALHLLTFNLHTGNVHITSIPRGTFVPLGFRDSSGNIISHVRSTRGRDALLRTVAKLCGRPSLEWYVEVGFSQAVGILELLGYADPMVELQALRKRKGYQQGDRNRSWNQGEFIRRAMLRALPMFEGFTGGLLLDAGMLLVDTNVPRDVALGLVYVLNDAGVPSRPESITHSLHGAKAGVWVAKDGDSSRAVPAGAYADMKPTTTVRAESVLRARLRDAHASERRPRAVRSLLWQIVQQRGWLQIPDRTVRTTLRDSLCAVLDRALAAQGDDQGRSRVQQILGSERDLFNQR